MRQKERLKTCPKNLPLTRPSPDGYLYEALVTGKGALRWQGMLLRFARIVVQISPEGTSASCTAMIWRANVVDPTLTRLEGGQSAYLAWVWRMVGRFRRGHGIRRPVKSRLLSSESQ